MSIVELLVNGVFEIAYNKVVTSLMVIVKCHLFGGNEENQEINKSLLLVFLSLHRAFRRFTKYHTN